MLRSWIILIWNFIDGDWRQSTNKLESWISTIISLFLPLPSLTHLLHLFCLSRFSVQSWNGVHKMSFPSLFVLREEWPELRGCSCRMEYSSRVSFAHSLTQHPRSLFSLVWSLEYFFWTIFFSQWATIV